MMRLLLVIGVLGCGSPAQEVAPVTPVHVTEEPPAAASDLPAQAEEFNAEALTVIGAMDDFQGWVLAPLRQFSRGPRVLVVVWPAIDPQGVLATDDDTLAVTLELNESGAYVVVGEPWNVQFESGDRVAQELGGADYEVVPVPGSSLDEVGSILEAAPAMFGRLAEAGEHRAAVRAAAEFARLYPADDVGQLENVAEAMLGVASGQLTVSHVETVPVSDGEANVRMSFGGERGDVEMAFRVEPNADGSWVIRGRARQ